MSSVTHILMSGVERANRSQELARRRASGSYDNAVALIVDAACPDACPSRPSIGESVPLSNAEGAQHRQVAEALRFFGESYGHSARDAELWLRQALFVAEQSGDTMLMAEIGASFVRKIGDIGARSGEALASAEDLRSQFQPDAHLQQAELTFAQAMVHSRSGDAEAALRAFQETLELRTQALGPQHRLVATTLLALAGSLRDLGVLDECDELLQESESILLDCGQLSEIAALRSSQARSLLERDFPEAALSRLFEARLLWVAEVGCESVEVATADNVIAETLCELDRLAEARLFAVSARTTLERRLGGCDVALANCDVTRGVIELADGEFAEAEATLYRALGLLEAHHMGEHPDLCRALHVLADACRGRGGSLDVAARLYRRAVEIHQRSQLPPHPLAALNLSGLAEVALLRGDTEEAIALADQAEEQLRRLSVRAATAARIRFTHAQAIIRRDRPRAEALARQAATDLGRLGKRALSDQAAVSGWLAALLPLNGECDDTLAPVPMAPGSVAAASNDAAPAPSKDPVKATASLR